jgi:tetratricopeptide (TPR) repeat protein
MSLLIKALETAEKDKQAELKKSKATAASAGLALEPISTMDVPKDAPAPAENSELDLGIAKGLGVVEDLGAAEGLGAVKVSGTGMPNAGAPSKADAFKASAAASVAKVRLQSEHTLGSKQQVAANVFVANKSLKNPTSKTALAMLGAAGAVIIWLGLQGYNYIHELNSPDIVVVRPVPSVPQVAAPPAVANSATSPAPLPEAQAVANQNAAVAVIEAPVNRADEAPVTGAVKNADSNIEERALLTNENTVAMQPDAAKKILEKKVKRSRDDAAEYNDASDEGSIGEKRRAPLKLLSRTPVAGVDPTLLAAYEAFSRGDDVAAQKQYRQVLQGDVRNIDALLGMAAIALRQGRYADANGWYQKVLEIEPRNSTALSASTNAQIGNDSAGFNSAASDFVGTESRIKNMLAQQPEAANLHAALGNLYAAQDQWALAQAAYFDASRFAPNSADYAFNLAVSLDQLGKSDLALAQYQRALYLLNSTGAGSLDKAQLEARIQALQR